MNTEDGQKLYELVTGFDFKILPAQFLSMSRNEISLLVEMKNRYGREVPRR